MIEISFFWLKNDRDQFFNSTARLILETKLCAYQQQQQQQQKV